jgi:aminoglycoside phosphotransferase (APT) family kinase protein
MADGTEIPGVDLERLAAWMDSVDLPGDAIERVETLGGGTQNILLRFTRGGRSFVLRRPPLHKRANSDETMRREARVLRALAGSDVPHPGFIAGSDEPDVLGATFYLMEPIRGFNPSEEFPARHGKDPKIRQEMGLNMASAIARLGELDYRKVGLEGFGKPDGYLERQAGRWMALLDSYASFEGYPGPDIPGLSRVAKWLDDNCPSDFRAGVLHGDFHVRNVMFSPDGPELAAMVDWELSTIGDPLLDLGLLLTTAPDASGESAGPAPWPGFPGAKELIARYAETSTRSLDAIGWYEVLACYKLGLILEGTHARAFAGKAPVAVGDALHATTLALFRRAVARIGA